MYAIQFLQFLSLCVLILSKNYINSTSESTVPSSLETFPDSSNDSITTFNLTPTNYTLEQIIKQINDSNNVKETLNGQEQVQNPSIKSRYSNGHPLIEPVANIFRDPGTIFGKMQKTEAFGDNSKPFSTARSLSQYDYDDEDEDEPISRDNEPSQGSKGKFEADKREQKEDSLPIQSEYDYDDDGSDDKDEEEGDDEEIENETPSNQTTSLSKPSPNQPKLNVNANTNVNPNIGEQFKERNGRNYYPVSRRNSGLSSQPESPISTDNLSINKFPSTDSSRQNTIPKSSIYSSSVIHYAYTGNENSNQEAFQQNNENKLDNGSMKDDVHLNYQSNNKPGALSTKLPDNHRSSTTLAFSGVQNVNKLLGNKRKPKDPFLRG
ncbi:circumsporozoite protein-like isoform X2 [Tetranychus urticae]|nr:circumsporozoite protein-like isoform X2 [Tetranychus urticae]